MSTESFVSLCCLFTGIALLVVAYMYPSTPKVIQHYRIQVIDICEANPAAARCVNPWNPFDEVETP
jgi:hypothetical protein